MSRASPVALPARKAATGPGASKGHAIGAVDIAAAMAEQPKSALYLEALPAFTRGQISIPDYAPLIRELRLLERRVSRSGKDSVDHPRGGSDDYANAALGAVSLVGAHTYDCVHSNFFVRQSELAL